MAAMARTSSSPAGPPEEGVPEDFRQLVLDIVKTPNPQFNQGARTGEAELMDVVGGWFMERGIQFEADPLWGMHAVVESELGPGSRPAVLLSAHLDSDNLELGALASLALDGDALRFDGLVGLDCKTGVAICLSVAERLRAGLTSTPWSLHLLFTVGEEAGQKGALRAPLPRLLAGKVRYGIVVDRKTNGSGAPRVGGRCVRHAVGTYKGVPLMDPDSREEMVAHLNEAMRRAEAPAWGSGGGDGELPLIESPNNADALEWRGRWDAEVVAPALLAAAASNSSSGEFQHLEAALAKYDAATKAVLKRMAKVAPEDRVSGMYAQPRIGRYKAMKEVFDAVHGKPLPTPDLRFSCVNLSYDYSDSASSVDLRELDLTARILMGFVESAASASESNEEETEASTDQDRIERVTQELRDLEAEPLDYISAGPVNDDMFHWQATMMGPDGTPYEGGIFFLDMYFPRGYPCRPLRVKLDTKIFHCNINENGSCLTVDDGILHDQWSPATTVSEVLLALRAILTDANPDADVARPDIASMYRENRSLHDATAREWVVKYAT